MKHLFPHVTKKTQKEMDAPRIAQLYLLTQLSLQRVTKQRKYETKNSKHVYIDR